VPAKGTARIRYAHGKLTGIDQIAVDGDGVLLRGEAVLSEGRVAGLRFARAVLGKSDLHGAIALPAGGPIGVTLAGLVLDVADKLTEKPARQPKPRTEPPPGPAWTLDARLDRVLLAHGKVATGVTARVSHDGRVTRALTAQGHAGDGAFQVSIDGARHLRVTAQDAGTFLRGADMIRSIEGGSLKLEGDYDDSTPEHALIGNAEITDFRVRNAPAMAKLLQAMTLYGLVDILRGPGIGFSRLVAPLRLDDDGLELREARAFSPSLGLTAKGRIDLAEERTDIQGTIVPAYFFNSLLGKVPLVGKLFSPEEGGGLFAARYSIRGPIEDPTVFVNPLSALTPGFLREMFGIF
jgi:hypothetical protein